MVTGDNEATSPAGPGSPLAEQLLSVLQISQDATRQFVSAWFDGASEFLIELFGEPGHHVRAAVGVNTLPLDATVEIEFIFQAANPSP